MSEESEIAKAVRVRLILERLKAAAPANTRAKALALIASVFDEVENECGIPPDRRIFPPVEAMASEVKNRPRVRRYRHTNHYTLIGDNGAIVIRAFIRQQVAGIYRIVGERTDLDKAGADGKTVDELSI
jgi:hypothetical protein